MIRPGNVYKTKGELVLVVTSSCGNRLWSCNRYRHGVEVMSGRYSDTDLRELFTLIGTNYTHNSRVKP